MRGEILYSEGGEALTLLPRAAGAPFLEVLKARWDGALDSLSWWGAASPWQGLGLAGL